MMENHDLIAQSHIFGSFLIDSVTKFMPTYNMSFLCSTSTVTNDVPKKNLLPDSKPTTTAFAVKPLNGLLNCCRIKGSQKQSPSHSFYCRR